MYDVKVGSTPALAASLAQLPPLRRNCVIRVHVFRVFIYLKVSNHEGNTLVLTLLPLLLRAWSSSLIPPQHFIR